MDDKTFMTNVYEWPRHPILPIKRRKPNDWPDCACLMHTASGILFVNHPAPFSREEVDSFVTKAKQSSVADIDKLIADGWVVD